ncbi:MAG TPA: hypothetical protein VI278_18510 [Nitrososphaeraceae archaeon]
MGDDEDDLTIAAACYNVIMEASSVMSSASPTSQYGELVTKLRLQSIAVWNNERQIQKQANEV